MKLVYAILLQLFGGTFFAIGLLGGSEALRARSLAEQHLKRRLVTIHNRAVDLYLDFGHFPPQPDSRKMAAR